MFNTKDIVDNILKKYFRIKILDGSSNLLDSDFKLSPRDIIFIINKYVEIESIKVEKMPYWTDKNVTYDSVIRYIEKIINLNTNCEKLPN